MATKQSPTPSATGGAPGASGRPKGWLTAVTALGASVFLIGGVWAFFWPYGFYQWVATYPPFNLHLFHDVGAFQLGIAAAMLAGLISRDAFLVGLVGGAVGATVHAVSHILDVDLGGRASDPYALSVLAVLLVVAAVARARARYVDR